MSVQQEPSVGVVAFSFGQRIDEPGPSNMALARAVKRGVESVHGPVEVVAQWEVATGLERLGVTPDVIVGPLPEGKYLDSEEVWRVARQRFERRGVESVIPVAQPFLHLWKVRHLARRDGLRVPKFEVGPINFDDTRENTQPWTRSRLALLKYTVAQIFISRRGR